MVCAATGMREGVGSRKIGRIVVAKDRHIKQYSSQQWTKRTVYLMIMQVAIVPHVHAHDAFVVLRIYYWSLMTSRLLRNCEVQQVYLPSELLHGHGAVVVPPHGYLPGKIV